MKRLLLIVLPLLLVVGCSKEPINYEETLNERDGVFYTKDSNKPYSGLVFSIHSNGFYSEQGTLEDGKKHGLWIQNYENSKLYIEENYNYGVKNGSFKKYDRNGEELEISNYLNGQYHGECKFIFPHFREEYSGNYINGKRDGEWKLINKDNINRDTWEYIPTIYTYKNGIEIPSERNDYHPFNDSFTEFYENGQKKFEGTYKDGRLDGLVNKWYDNGQKKFEGTYKDGKEDGLVDKWYDNGQKNSEGTYKDGKEDGLWTHWSPDGKNKSEIIFKEGESSYIIERSDWDKITKWYINGQKEFEIEFYNGKKHGYYTEWYINGQKKSVKSYSEGKLNGYYTEWYKNGQKKKYGNFFDGKYIGLHTSWYENGMKWSETTYENGFPSKKSYKKDGSVYGE